MSCRRLVFAASPLGRISGYQARSYVTRTQTRPAAAAVKKANKSPGTEDHHSTGAVPVNVGKHAPSPTARKRPAEIPPSTSPKNTLKAGSHQGKPAPAATPTKSSAEQSAQDVDPMNPEEQLKQLEQIAALERMSGHLDIWGQRVQTLDVQMPYSVNVPHWRTYNGARSLLSQVIANIENGIKNAVSMYRLAMENSIPGFNLEWPNRRQRYLSWPYNALGVTRSKPGSWISPFRNIALETYQSYNTALANADSKTVKRLTTDTFQDNAIKLLRSRPSGTKYSWKFHREVSPPTILSVRVMEGHLGVEGPRMGNRLMAHVLVRFDTEQSIAVYNPRGGLAGKPEPQRVTEYLVFEKRMWYNDPWTIREQLYEGVGRGPLSV